MYKFTNNAQSTLAESISNSSINIKVTSGTGSKFPAITAPDVFTVTLTNGDLIEIVTVTAKTSDTFTVLRGQEGTLARAWAVGTLVSHRATAAFFNSLANPSSEDSAPTVNISGVAALIMDYAGGDVPQGWLLCDHAQYSPSAYPFLFAKIGYTYGRTGDNFHVPESRGRVVVGSGSGPGLTTRALGDLGGEERHTTTIAETPEHDHSNPSNPSQLSNYEIDNPGVILDPPGANANIMVAKNLQVNVNFPGSSNMFGDGVGPFIGVWKNGGNQPHNNMQPFMVATKIICTGQIGSGGPIPYIDNPIAFRATYSGSATITGVNAVIGYSTIDYDSHSSFNTSSSIFTAPASGKYNFSTTTVGVNGATSNQINIGIIKVGDIQAIAAKTDLVDAGAPFAISCSGDIELAQGEIVSVQISSLYSATINESMFSGHMVASLIGTEQTVIDPQAFYAVAGVFSVSGETPVTTYTSKTYDSNDCFSISTGLFTAKVPGYYHFSVTQSLYSASNNQGYVSIFKGSVPFAGSVDNDIPGGTGAGLSCSGDIYLSTGDVVSVKASLNSSGQAQGTIFTGHLISTSGAGTQEVSFRVNSVASQAIPSSTNTLVTFDTKDFDTTSAFNLTTDKFIVPIAGRYSITYNCQFDNMANAPRQYFAYIRQNGVNVAVNGGVTSTGFSDPPICVTALINCSVGDEITVQVFQSDTTPINLQYSVFSGFMIK